MQNNEIIKPAKYFSELEKSILLALVEKYKYVLECKKSDARTIALKQRTWQALAHEYNSQPSVSLRDFKQLKKCWESIKARTKKIMAHERREKVKRSVSPLLSTHVLGKEKIANVLPDQLYFLQSPPEEEPEYHPEAAAQVFPTLAEAATLTHFGDASQLAPNLSAPPEVGPPAQWRHLQPPIF
ncbi:myb/SANT-like DNA-binding domain-containing protein 3 isoform X3 [Cynocephalus volans]|uniref:myb/SANT-like DNA-binding domain-containing protein 3 isoform X3 n=1 Tax=Cynocephalus volans TaxID=110931 RepID=UPI002FC6AF89